MVSSLDILVDEPSDPNWFKNFVLLFPERPSIRRFCLNWRYYFDALQIKRWVDALMCHNIRELELCNENDNPRDLQIPASLFSCETLVALKLFGMALEY